MLKTGIGARLILPRIRGAEKSAPTLPNSTVVHPHVHGNIQESRRVMLDRTQMSERVIFSNLCGRQLKATYVRSKSASFTCQNSYIDSFNYRLHDEYRNEHRCTEIFTSQVVIEALRIHVASKYSEHGLKITLSSLTAA